MESYDGTRAHELAQAPGWQAPFAQLPQHIGPLLTNCPLESQTCG
jgi:hypothetical protein